MGRLPASARITLVAAALVLVAGVVSASIPGLFGGGKRTAPPVAAPLATTTVPAPTATTLPAPTATTAPAGTSATTQAPVTAAPAAPPPAFISASQSRTLPRTGPPTRNLFASGIALVLLGGVLVLSQHPEPYAPRHRQRRTRPSAQHRRKRRNPAMRLSAVESGADHAPHLFRFDEKPVVAVKRTHDRNLGSAG